jgi:glutaconate CoA-transferase, subunit B
MLSYGFLADGYTVNGTTGRQGDGQPAVVTDFGIREPDETGEMMLAALHPGLYF